MLEICEHPSSSYSPRTYVNAQGADLTVAFATDFSTAGERLTHKAAGHLYAAIPLGGDPIEAARQVYRALRSLNAHTINIAGNGIYTLTKHGWTQETVNAWVYATLAQVHAHWPLVHVRSGGQSGVDEAGVTAAYALGIPALALLPKGFIQRGADKIDRQHHEQDIRQKIIQGAQLLERQVPRPALPAAGPLPATGTVRVVSKRQGGTQAAPGETIIDGDRNDPTLGNPHILQRWNDPDERAAVIERHRLENLEPDVLAGGPIYRKMLSLADRVRAGERIAIACWCAPLPCHCDPIAEGIFKLAQGVNLQDKYRAEIAARTSPEPAEKLEDLQELTFYFD